ncbi:MAG: hypothetical protein LBH86_09110 [Oscillospiraceae bacterium]|jgi:putative transcriptional regulator|nr:hypothetical protein [Oscillospiraceae bacterium]
MPYTPIAINRRDLTIMDVPFPDLETLESTAEAIGSNMFEGFQPTKKGIESQTTTTSSGGMTSAL